LYDFFSSHLLSPDRFVLPVIFIENVVLLLSLILFSYGRDYFDTIHLAS